MASRVNVRFVTILAAAMAAVFVGMAATAWFVFRKSAEDQAALGDQAMAEGDYRQAQDRYGRAISKDRANIEYYEKFRDALTAWNPENDAVYQEAFFKYLGALTNIAMLRQTDVDAHHDYLRARLEILNQAGASRAAWEGLAGETEDALANFTHSGADLDAETARRWPTLRRYRGIAYQQLVAAGQTISAEEAELAVEDLQAAIEADPSDTEACESLVLWHANQGERARTAGRTREATEAYDRALAAADRGLRDNPGDPFLQISRLRVLATIRQAEISRLATAEERRRQIESINAGLAGDFEQVTSLLLSQYPADKLTTRLLLAVRTLEPAFSEEGALDATFQILERAQRAHAGDPTYLYLEGRFAAETGDHERAIATLDRFGDIERPPVSLDGMLIDGMKNQALVFQARAAIALADAADADSAEHTAQIERARTFRERLAERIPSNSAQLKLLDAQIAFADDEPAEAQRLLTEFSSDTGGGTPESLDLHSRVLFALNQPGAARDKLKSLVSQDPSNAVALYRLGLVHERLEEYEDAEKAYTRAMEIAAGNQDIARRLKAVRVYIGKEQADDPIEQVIADAERLRRPIRGLPPEPEKALAMIVSAIETHGEDYRLIDALFRFHMALNQREQAMQIVQDAAARNPDDEDLARLLKAASAAAQTPEQQLAAIAASDASEEDKLEARYYVDRAAGRTEEADTAIDRLAAINPDNPVALDALFVRALNAQDLATAARLAERAARTNADKAGGLTFRGRLLIQQGEFEEAVQALRDAVDRGMASIDVQRLLASAQMQLGRSNDALRTLRSALAADPSNFRTIMQTLETLLALGRYDEALRLARESESYAGVNDAFVHTWLQLEAEVGDIALAQRRREEILTNRPEDQANRLALAQIYVQQRDRRAPQLIEQIRAENDSLAAVDLQARWRLSQGDNDGAAAIYRQYIDGLDEGDRDNALNAYLAFYRLVRSTGDTDAAIAVLEEARAVQDPQIMQADFTLARLYAELSRPAQAADAYQRILDGGAADEDGLLRLSLAEASISAGDAQKAISVLDALPDRLRASPGAEILRSEAMRAMGRTADADRMLDDAIARAPDYPAGFYKRAELALAAVRQDDGAMSGATRTAMLNDAIADLTRSIELSPAFWPALQLRADAHLMAGRLDDAVRDVDRAVAVNPALAPMLLQIIDRLLSQERFTDAARVAEQATRSHPEDFALLQAIGDRFVAAGRSAEAIALYNTAWNASRNTAIAARLVELTLGLPSPDLRRAREVISDPALSVDESPALLMLRARLEKAAGRPQQMLADARKSLELVIDKPEALRFWLEGSQKLFDESQRADWLRFMGEAQLGRAPDGWGFALLGSMLVQRPDTIQQGMELLEQVVETSSDPIAASAAGGDLGSAYFALGRHEEAVAAWKQSLERRPSPEIANNIAFTLADDLGRPDEALPFAQQAVEGRPTDPSILDTLGVVQTRLGMYEEAAGTLQAALQYAGQSPERSGPVLMHLARLEAQRGNKTEAAEYLERARTALQGPSGARYRETLEGLQKQIDQL